MEKDSTARNGDLASPFLLRPGGLRLIQIQSTRRCNLRCKHCYSESGPESEDDTELSKEHLASFLRQAKKMGYGYIGVSGGEPLLWPDLEQFLQFAVELGYRTSVVTNGTLLNADNAAKLRHLAHTLAVSVDGPPEEHVAMRGAPHAFSAMREGLSVLQQMKIPFTIMFTLTRHNANRLSWLYQFAQEVEAAAIEIHPLASSGAASQNLNDAVPGSIEFQVASWLLALIAHQHPGSGPRIIMDAIARTVVERSPWPLLDKQRTADWSTPFCDLVPSLVVEADGRIVPFVHGFARHQSIGFIGEGDLSDCTHQWRQTHGLKVASLLQETLGRLAASKIEIIDLFDELRITANRATSFPS